MHDNIFINESNNFSIDYIYLLDPLNFATIDFYIVSSVDGDRSSSRCIIFDRYIKCKLSDYV